MKDDQSLTEEMLCAIESRCEAASVGPWFSYVVGRNNMEAGLNCIELGSAQLIEVLGGTIEDQEFIASAREDLPLLLREVRLLRAKLRTADSGDFRSPVDEYTPANATSP